MPAMALACRIRRRLVAMPRFELGDRVRIKPGNQEGVVIGVRYGEPAYDVRCSAGSFRNLPAERLSLALPGLWAAA